MTVIKQARFAQWIKTTANWAASPLVLKSGELGIEILTNGKKKIKAGDNSHTWADLDYLGSGNAMVSALAPTSSDTTYAPGDLWVQQVSASVQHLYVYTYAGIWQRVVVASELDALGAGDMLKSTYDANNDGVVDSAAKLHTARAISITGDGAGSQNFDGSAAAAIELTLAASGVTAGTYEKVTVDSKGRVTVGAALAASDIPTLLLSKISDAGSAASYNIGTTAGTIPVLTTDGKIALARIPDAILGQLVYGGTVDAAGVCTLTDNAKTKLGITTLTISASDTYEGIYFIASAAGTSGVPSSLGVNTGDWIVGNGAAGWGKIDNSDAVMTVNGKIGTVVLSTDDIAEGSTHLYWTAARFASAFATALAAVTTDSLAEGSTNKYFTDARALAAAFPTDLIIDANA